MTDRLEVLIRTLTTCPDRRQLGERHKFLHHDRGQRHTALEAQRIDLLIRVLLEKVFQFLFIVGDSQDLEKRLLVIETAMVRQQCNANLLLSDDFKLLRHARHNAIGNLRGFVLFCGLRALGVNPWRLGHLDGARNLMRRAVFDVAKFILALLEVGGPALSKGLFLCLEVPEGLGEHTPLIHGTDTCLEIRLLERPFVDKSLGFLARGKASENAKRAVLATNALLLMSQVLDEKAVGKHGDRSKEVGFVNPLLFERFLSTQESI